MCVKRYYCSGNCSNLFPQSDEYGNAWEECLNNDNLPDAEYTENSDDPICPMFNP